MGRTSSRRVGAGRAGGSVGRRPLAVAAGLLLVLVPLVGGRAVARPARAMAGLSSLPPSARAAVSASLGSDVAAYRAQQVAGGYRLQGGGVSATFGRAGALISGPGGTVSILLSGVGRDTHQGWVWKAKPSGHGNRVRYTRAGLAEWYKAGPLGLEQGFTLTRRPAGRGPLALTLHLGGTLRPRQAGQQLRLLAPSGGTSLSYGGLTALDADHHRLPAILTLHGHTLTLRVEDSGARYPIRIDPFIQTAGKLTGTGESGGANFGQSVALSADGSTALIGGPHDAAPGAAWVFTRSGGVWSQQGGKLTGTGEIGAGSFGFSVALSADGSTALIGGPNDASNVGAAWVFTRSGGAWSQQGGKLTGAGESGTGQFGSSVALSADGSTALIGGPFDASGVGAAWVFTRSSAVWIQQGGKLTGTGESGAGNFGFSVALSADGSTALGGGTSDAGSVGAAWVFTRSGGVWSQQGGKLTGTGESGGGGFGYSVALSADGSTALVGGAADAATVGAVWVFTRSGGAWSQQGGKLTGTGENGVGSFGFSVALSADGSTALVGGPVDASFVGAAWVFTRSGGVWSQQGGKLTGTGESGAGYFGYSVALSADGSTALVGGPADASFVGAGWVFAAPGLSLPGSLRFGAETTGLAGAEQWLEVSNPGQLPFTFTGSASVSGTNAGDFAIPSGDDLCAFRTVSPGQVCWIGVQFTAGASGTRSANLTLSGNYNGLATPSVALTGVGVAPNSGPTGPAGPGGVRLLPSPVRAYDSRVAAAGALGSGNGDTANPRVIPILGAIAGVPANAIGVVGNIAVTQETGVGFATIWPSGPWPGTANINFTAAADLSNFFNSGLSSTGTISIAASATTHVVIDITGYILP